MAFLEERVTDMEIGCCGVELEFVNILNVKIPDFRLSVFHSFTL